MATNRQPAPTSREHPSVNEPILRLAISPWIVARALFAISLVLVFAHLIFAINERYVGLDFFGATFLYVVFDLQGEVTIPTWYSTILLSFSAIVLAAIGIIKHRSGDPYRVHWLGLSLIFLVLSIDEAADIHGAVSYKLQNVLRTDGVLTYPWILPAAIIVALVGLLYLRFLVQLRTDFRRQLVIAVLLFIGGAVIMEAVEAAFDSAYGDGFPYLLMATVEEAMEMVGTILFITAFLSYLGSLASNISIDIASD